MRVAVIGAGLSGLACADVLRQEGKDVVVFEKSRGIGGRLATRRTPENLRFDHGAQFFTIRTKSFKQFLAGRAVPWEPRTNFDVDEDWFIGTPDMKSFLRPVADRLDIRLNTKVGKVSTSGDYWSLDFGESLDKAEIFDKVVVTAPSPQALSLTQDSHLIQAALGQVQMAPTWSIMFTLRDPSNWAFDVWRDRKNKISWLARNSHKDGRAGSPESWVLHGSSEWSAANLERDKDEIMELLLPEALQLMGKTMDDIIYFAAHRWRFARVTTPLGRPFISDETNTLFAAGDWCLGARVEDAFTSGYELGLHINQNS